MKIRFREKFTKVSYSLKTIIPIGVLIVSLISFASVLISPQVHWSASVLGYGIPIMIAVNIFLLSFFIIKKSRWAWLQVVALLCAIPFYSISFNLDSDDHGVDYMERNTFSVLSYNAKLFRPLFTYSLFSHETIDWVVEDTSDIKCIQEFSYFPERPHLNVINMMKDKGYFAYNFETNTMLKQGVAIFSKYPIVGRGKVNPENYTKNNIIYADIKIETDTIRIYNAHLKSMKMDMDKYKEEVAKVKNNMTSMFNKLRQGAVNRAKQIDLLLEHAGKSPYPVIICGDFNETPYSYNYFKVRSHYKNAFEQKGNGFGFTYNQDRLPIRIDHQFYNEKVELLKFKTCSKIKFSDHFPLKSVYALKRHNRIANK